MLNIANMVNDPAFRPYRAPVNSDPQCDAPENHNLGAQSPPHIAPAPKPFGQDDPITFNPVPSKSKRRDGWTPKRQSDFIHALQRGHSVTAATRAVGMSRRSAHRLRERPGAKSFCKAWDMAISMAKDDAVAMMHEQCVTGELHPVYYQGRIIAWRRHFDANFTIMSLRAMFNARKLHSRATQLCEKDDISYLSDFIEGRIPIDDFTDFGDDDEDDWG